MGIRWSVNAALAAEAHGCRHDEGMAAISNVVTALFADIVSEAAIRPENIPL